MNEPSHSVSPSVMGLTAPPKPAPGFWRRHLVEPLLGQLKQGATPEKLAQSLAWGGLLGVFPILGTTTALCGIMAVWLRLNHIAIQVANWLVYPLQVLLIIPFLRLGNFLFVRPQFPLSIAEITDAFARDFWGATSELGWLALRGIVAWTVIAIPLALLFTRLLTPVIRHLAATRPGKNEAV